MKQSKNENYIDVMIGSGEHSTFVKTKKGKKIMIGNGEHATFIKAELTTKEASAKLNNKIDKLFKYTPKEKIQKIKEKTLSKFKKN